jgi:predicted transposase/invertase (TIGR01784 family)
MNDVRIAPGDDLLNICSDPVLKAVLTKDTPESRGALRSVLSAYTGKQVSDVQVRENEPAVGSIIEKKIRLDVNCRFNDGELAEVEMTLFPTRYEPWRQEYYVSKLCASQNMSGRKYKDLKQVYQITFIGPDRQVTGDKFMIHNFSFYDKEHALSLGGRVSIITIELSKMADKPVEELTRQELWAYYLRYGNDPEKANQIKALMKREEGIMMAANTLSTISRDENEAARLLYEEKILNDWESGLDDAREDGITIGEQRRDAEILRMLDSGMSVDQLRSKLSAYK